MATMDCPVGLDPKESLDYQVRDNKLEKGIEVLKAPTRPNLNWCCKEFAPRPFLEASWDKMLLIISLSNELPVAIWTLKLSNIGPGQHLDGRLLGYSWCFWQVFGSGVVKPRCLNHIWLFSGLDGPPGLQGPPGLPGVS